MTRKVDRRADSPQRNIPVTKPVREAKARLWAVAPLMMMMMNNIWRIESYPYHLEMRQSHEKQFSYRCETYSTPRNYH
jgi:hypothetical protein